jgi:hypothetical protein
MRCTDQHAYRRTTVREEDSSLFVALELSKSVWLTAASSSVESTGGAASRRTHASRVDPAPGC